MWLVLPLARAAAAADLLPAVRRADLADRPDRGDGHPEVGRRAEEPRARDRRRVAVQRRRRRRASSRCCSACWPAARRRAPATARELLLHEAGGGLLFGLVLGYVTFRLLRSIDNYQVEVLLTLAAVMGGYALASRLHVSGPLAMVVAGLMIGNHGRALAMSDTTRHHVDMFWELLDEILNAVLFVLIGMEVLAGRASPPASSLAARCGDRWSRCWRALLTVGLPVAPAAARASSCRAAPGSVLTWGGLRGGISVALALSLPAGPERETAAGADLLRRRVLDPGAGADDRQADQARHRQ